MAATATVTPAPRLAPSARMRGILPRLISAYMQFHFGKVMSVVRILYARLPGMVWGQLMLERFSQRGLSLEPELRHLIELRISEDNGCSFCADLSGAMVALDGGAGVPVEDVRARPDDPRFDARTQAVLGYVTELGRDRTVSDATFAALRAHCSERQVAEVVWLTAFTHYHNLMAKPLGLVSEGFCEIARNRKRP